MDYFTLEEAHTFLRCDTDTENDALISSLIGALPEYVEVTTGYYTDAEPSTLAKAYARFVLTLWYNPDGTEAEQLRRTIDSVGASLRAVSNACRVE